MIDNRFFAAFLPLLFAVSGCVSSQADINSKSWVGRPAKELMAVAGRPSEMVMGSDSIILTYRQTNSGSYQKSYDYYTQNADGSLQANSNPYSQSYSYTCTQTYRVNAAGIVIDGKASGQCQ